MEKSVVNCVRFSGTYPWYKMWPHWVCIYVCLFLSFFVYLCSRVFLFASYSFPLYFFLPSQFISHDTQALLLRKEFLKTPPLLVTVIHTTNDRKDIWSPFDVALPHLCFHTGCCTYVFNVPHRVQYFWRLHVMRSFRGILQYILSSFPWSLGPKSWVPTRTSSVQWYEPIMER